MGIVWIFLSLHCQTVFAQKFRDQKQAEDSLYMILKRLNLSQSDSITNILNQSFSDNLAEALKLPVNSKLPFDSLKRLIKIESPDRTFRIFHWNLPTRDGKHRYYGYLQVIKQKSPVVFPLADMSDSLVIPDTSILGPSHWYGALYYKIIPNQTASGSSYYTLLGWAAKNSRVAGKVIEILSFDNTGRPLFGKRIFPGYQDGGNTRIIFRFSSATTMALKYENQVIETDRQWNKSKRTFESTRKEIPMIVLDRMVPPDPSLERQYQYYIAAGDVFDGFMLKNNAWVFVPGIDARNKNQDK
jgi:hypothetical protein